MQANYKVRVNSGAMASTVEQEPMLATQHHNGKPHILPVNGGPVLSPSSTNPETGNGTTSLTANGSGIG